MYPALTWKDKATLPAQKVQTSSEDNNVAKAIVALANGAKSTYGPGLLDNSTPEYKELDQKYIGELTAGIKTPEQWAQAIDEAMANAAKKK